MPNWCYNTLTIEGKQENRDAFRKFAVGDEVVHNYNSHRHELLPLCFKRFIPPPSLIFDEDWDETAWCHENWGTKWEPQDVEVIVEGFSLCYTFDTAWAPPRQIVEAAAERFPTLKVTLEYEEPQMGFRGIYERLGETVLQDGHWRWEWIPEDELDALYESQPDAEGE